MARKDAVEAPPAGRCRVCGQPLGADQAYWVTHPPDGEHDRCRDWSSIPFPYDHELESLRALAKYYQRAYQAVVRVGCDLADVRRTWPRGGGAALAAYRKKKEALRKKLERLKWPSGW